MKQLNFINNSLDTSKICKKQEVNYWQLFIDGASRNNPGPSGAGVYILKNEKPVCRNGFFLGIKTNNQAEYLALSLGIFCLKKHICKDDLVMIVSDSQLLVRQMLGEYKVKSPDLKQLFKLANDLLQGINYNIMHVLRSENKEADEMANIGIDGKKKVPHNFLKMLLNYEIQL